MVEQQGRVFYHKRMKPCGIKEESATYGRESSPSSPVGSLSSSRGGTGRGGEGQRTVDENMDEGVSVHLSQSQQRWREEVVVVTMVERQVGVTNGW